MIFNELMTGLNEAVGMESISDAPMTELEEMNAEIQDMIALESALDEEFAYNTLAFCDNTEATNALLAMREVGLESTQGMDPAKIYEGFGIESEIAMEAAKDVLARKAYAGVAAIKALIATCIKWLKSLFGITVASKKVFTSLSKKAKDMKKQLSKKSGSAKINSEKLKRELPVYSSNDKGIAAICNLYVKHTGLIAKLNSSTGMMASESEELDINGGIGMESKDAKKRDIPNPAKNAKESNAKDDADASSLLIKSFTDNVSTIKTKITEVKEDVKKLPDLYDKTSTEEKAGSEVLTYLTTALGVLENIKSNIGSVDNVGKTINKTIKSLEKEKSRLDKVYKDTTASVLPSAQQSINTAITLLTEIHKAAKTEIKMIVKIADDLLTMSKGVLAAIY